MKPEINDNSLYDFCFSCIEYVDYFNEITNEQLNKRLDELRRIKNIMENTHTTIKFNGKEVTSFDDLSPLEIYPSLFYTELTLNGEKFGVYIKKEDEGRLIKVMKGKQ